MSKVEEGSAAGLRTGFGGIGKALHGPAGESAGQFLDVFLRIAAAHTERVEFQYFAPEVFVEPARLQPTTLAQPFGLAAGALREELVEIGKHARMQHGAAQKIGEAARDMRPDRTEFERSGKALHPVLVG